MRTSILLLSIAVTSFGVWSGASPAMAQHGCAHQTRAMLRCQEEMLEDERDLQIDAMRASTEQQKDQLRCWYKAERAAMDAEYDRARRCLDRCARRQLARDHDDREDALRHYYYQQRAALRKGQAAAELQTRQHYRQMERALKYGVTPVHYTPGAEVILAPTPTLAPTSEPTPETIPVPAPLLPPTPAPTLAPELPPQQLP